MGKRRFSLLTVLVFALLFMAPLEAGAQCCDDCDGNGVVTIDEILTGVNNALNGCSMLSTSPTPGPSPTPLPDQCATDPPGTRLTVLGTDYVVVEYEVVLENSPDTYLLRYPTALDRSGHLTYVYNPVYLQQVCYQNSFSCSSELGSICGFPAAFYAYGDVSGTASASYSEDTSGAGTWGYSLSGGGSAYVMVDAAHELISVSFSVHFPSVRMNVPDFSSFSYSFADANYPAARSADMVQIRSALSSLFAHISLTRAPLPTPPTFPPTPTPRPCLPSGADCDYYCFVVGQTSCCPPFVCSVFGQCVTPKPTPAGPPATATPPCPR